MTPDTVDVAVIGAGPAGLTAAATAAGYGLTVALLDEQAAPGGQVWRGMEGRGVGGPGVDRRGLAAIARVRNCGARLRFGATVLDIDRDLTLTWLEPAGIGRTQARAVILATGAMERPLPFPGWTLPGVLGVGALQTALKAGGLVPTAEGGGLVIAGHGPLVLLYLAQLAALGGRPAAVLDLGSADRVRTAASLLPSAVLADPLLIGRGAVLLARRALQRVPVRRGVRLIAAEGRDRVEAVRFADAQGEQVLPCSLLAVHDGVIPNTQLSRLLRLDHEWREATRCFAPVTDPHGRSSRDGIWVAGDGAGIEGAVGAEISGRLAALDAARSLGALTEAGFRKAAEGPLGRRTAIRKARRFLDTLDPPIDPTPGLADGTIVCRCEEVTAGTIRAAVKSGADDPNRVKTATRCGMGACQGRMCGPVLTRLIAREARRPETVVGALRVRPPLKPVPLGALAAVAEE